eukprot:3572735-Pyramimonas_sp.AAC.1
MADSETKERQAETKEELAHIQQVLRGHRNDREAAGKEDWPRIYGKRARTTTTARCTDCASSTSGMGEDRRRGITALGAHLVGRRGVAKRTWEAPARWGPGCAPA